ncbi:unnamed protein product [Protopolystoma xenopodis]|uniref:Uncharacterized protein n=1 Tax=Protopolystoma xenopodis TaxID=117903 RepID=A0A3S5A2J1_9PLAT|nr:unnamed protein product [Protopolystoma xenopodis]
MGYRVGRSEVDDPANEAIRRGPDEMAIRCRQGQSGGLGAIRAKGCPEMQGLPWSKAGPDKRRGWPAGPCRSGPWHVGLRPGPCPLSGHADAHAPEACTSACQATGLCHHDDVDWAAVADSSVRGRVTAAPCELGLESVRFSLSGWGHRHTPPRPCTHKPQSPSTLSSTSPYQSLSPFLDF